MPQLLRSVSVSLQAPAQHISGNSHAGAIPQTQAPFAQPSATAEGQERMDSLSAVAYASLALGTRQDTMIVRGVGYRKTATVSQYSPLVKRVEVTIEPLSGGSGPDYSASTYVAGKW